MLTGCWVHTTQYVCLCLCTNSLLPIASIRIHSSFIVVHSLIRVSVSSIACILVLQLATQILDPFYSARCAQQVQPNFLIGSVFFLLLLLLPSLCSRV